MRIDKALINMLGESSTKVNDLRDFPLKDNFKSTLDIITNRNLSTNTNLSKVDNRREQRRDQGTLKRESNNTSRDTEGPRSVKRDKSLQESNYISSGSLADTIEVSEYTEDPCIESECILETEKEKLYNEILCSNIICAISEVLNMSNLDIESILEDLNITPNEIINIDTREFLQEVFNVESTVDLLDIPNIHQLLSNLEESLEEVYVDAERLKDDMLIRSLAEGTEALFTEQTGYNNSINKINSESDSVENYYNEEEFNFNDQGNELQGEFSQGNESSSNNKEQSHNNTQSNSKVIDADLNQNNVDNQVTYKGDEIQKANSNDPFQNYKEEEITFSKVDSTTVSKVVSSKSMSTQNLIAKDVINQIQGKIKADVKLGTVSEIKMLLKPENLGEISIKVLTENGIVTAKILADNQKVKEIIEANLNELKQSLGDQGIEVSELSVSVGQDESSQKQLESFFKEQEKSKLRINQIIKNISSDTEEGKEEINNNLPDAYDSSVNYTA